LSLESDLEHYQPIQFFLYWPRYQRANLQYVRRILGDFKPDVVLVWSMWNLSAAIPYLFEQLHPQGVVYQVSGDWPHAPSVHEQYWQSPARRWYRRWPKRMLGVVARWMLRQAPSPRQLQFRHVLAVSHAIRQELIEKTHIPPENIHVIYNGIDPAPFLRHSRLNRPIRNDQSLKVLYAGGLAQHKGVHTVIEAVARLHGQRDDPEVTLTIVGSGHPDYEGYLHRLVEKEGIGPYVTFRPRVPREEVARILGEHDIFVLPSLYEPLARMLQEAMATGLAVVGTDAWGTREVLVEGVNGLTFQPGDAEELAQQLARLVDDPDLRRRLGEAARQTVLERFTLDRMVDETEAYLEGVVSRLTAA
jgi:glycosyltransferase involved in cell wall biosynthesis